MQKLYFLLMLFLVGCARYETDPLPSASTTEIQNVAGKKVYEKDCVACHGNDGTGVLAGVPDLTQVAGFKQGTDYEAALFKHIEHVEKGKKTPGNPIAMPAKGGDPDLTNQDIREVLKYMHEKFSSE